MKDIPLFLRSHLSYPIYIAFALQCFIFILTIPVFSTLIFHPEHHIIATNIPTDTKQFLLNMLLIAYPIGMIFGLFIFGHFSDRWGRKKILLICLSIIFVGYLLNITSIYTKSFHTLFIGHFLTGLAGINVICISALADLFPSAPQRRIRFGIFTAIRIGAYLIIITMGGVLANPILIPIVSPTFNLSFAAILSLVNFLFIWVILIETRYIETPKPSLKDILKILRYPKLKPIFCIFFLLTLSWTIMVQSGPRYVLEVLHISQSANFAIHSFVTIIWFLSAWFLNMYLVPRMSAEKVLIISLLISTILLLFLQINSYFFLQTIIAFIHTVFVALAWVSTVSIASLAAESSTQGKTLGICITLEYLALLFGAGLIAGYLNWSIERLGWISTTAIFISLLIAYFYFRKEKVEIK